MFTAEAQDDQDGGLFLGLLLLNTMNIVMYFVICLAYTADGSRNDLLAMALRRIKKTELQQQETCNLRTYYVAAGSNLYKYVCTLLC